MRPHHALFRNGLLAISSFALSVSIGTGQQSLFESRVRQPISETGVTSLKGNTHPLARPEFDRGQAPADLPLDRMLLVLRRSSQHETGLTLLRDQRQEK